MPDDRLTRVQRRLMRELDELCKFLALDYREIRSYDREWRTVRLRLAKEQLVRSQVVIWYTLVDEFLSMRIARLFFSRKRSFPQLWRTKQFRLFNYHILEELSLLQKLRFARAIKPILKGIVADIERLNAVRNGLAHAFFPENLKKSKPVWKGGDIYTLATLQRMGQDVQAIFDHFTGLEDDGA